MTEQSYVDIKDVEVRNHSSRVIPLWVNGRPPYRMIFDPVELDFGGGTVGVPSEPMTLTITNDGFQTLDFTSVEVLGGDFRLVSPVPTELKVGATLDLKLTYTAHDYVVSSGVLKLDLGLGGIYEIRLKGMGVWDHIKSVDLMLSSLWGFIKRSVQPALINDGPELSLSNTSVVFKDEVEVGKQSEIMTVTVSNAGNRDLILGDLSITGDFEIIP